MQQLSSGVGSLISRMDRLLSWATEYDQQKRLAAQQVIGHNAGQIGLALLLVAVGVTALKVGRVWEVHQVRLASVSTCESDTIVLKAVSRPGASSKLLCFAKW